MAVQFATSLPAPSKFLLIYLLLLSIFSLMQCRDLSTSSTREPLTGLRLELVHRDSLLFSMSPRNLTSTELMKRAVQRSQDRLQKLQMSVVPKTEKLGNQEIVSQVNAESGEFLMKIAIGNPSLSYYAILDTGSDLIWTQCKPCLYCFPQPTPIYDPSKSSTYSKVPCSSSMCKDLPYFACIFGANCEYLYPYGGGSYTNGTLAYETFTLSSQPVPHIAFGCGNIYEGGYVQGSAGLVGFGRGPLSFMSQIAASVGNKFSYCLVSVTDPSSKTSPLFIGEAASLSAKTFSSTPLIRSSFQPTYYYLSLEGISFDGKLLNIPAGTFDLQSNGTGGVVIDSGTTVTYLEQAAYDLVKKAVISAINLPQVDGYNIGLDLCYNKPPSTTNFPTMIFHFKGADYYLPKENYIYVDSSGVICLAMLPSSGMSIFGNMQQQNYQILYDNGKNRLSFARTVCDSL